MQKKSQTFGLVYRFDPTIRNWQERLASAYEQLFDKIDQVEAEEKLKGSKEERIYGESTVHP